MPNEELTELEKKVLSIMFKNLDTVIEFCDGVLNLYNSDTFDRNDLFNLAEKLGIDY